MIVGVSRIKDKKVFPLEDILAKSKHVDAEHLSSVETLLREKKGGIVLSSE